jgi:hypothetical protein
MSSTLPASHLVRQYLLFAFTVVFLLTMVRAGYALWKFPELEETQAFVALFLQGLRFDIALIGFVSLIPVVLGSLLSMSRLTGWLAKFVICGIFFTALFAILLLELITPWFVETQGIRPDAAMIMSVDLSADALLAIAREHVVPLAIGSVLCLLIIIAFWFRMELRRFLNYRVSVLPALATAIIGGAVCLVAIWSNPDLRKPALSTDDAVISESLIINDITLNTTYKTVYSIVMPLLSPLLQESSADSENDS